MNKYTLINKNFILNEEATISTEDRAFKFGDGIFETCKIYNGKIYDFLPHLNRFHNGLKALKIDFDCDNLENLLNELILKNKAKNGTLRFSLSRGSGSMGFLPFPNIKANFVAQTYNLHQPDSSKKIRLGISEIKLSQPNEFLKNCKLSQNLPYILAKIEARKNNNFDDILLDENGFICETSSANIFFIKDGEIFTSSQELPIIQGIVRQKIIENFQVKQVKIKIEEILKYQEIFITNSNLLALKINELNYKEKIYRFSGEFTKKIQDFLENDVKNSCK